MICEVTPSETLLDGFLPSFRADPPRGAWDWICENGRMQNGQVFDGDVIPWCRGVCDAWDNPYTREIVLQWGTRLGKTTVGMQLMAYAASVKPRPGLFASSTQDLTIRTVRNKIYPILESVPQTSVLLPPVNSRTVKEIRLKNSIWFVAWSGSDTQLADLSAFYGYANEIDKWSMNDKLGGDAGEGDPLDQFEERFKEFWDAKILFECSPSTKRHSRIEKKLNTSNNCRYWVPCPKCGGYQVLRFGADDPMAGGVLFDRPADNSLDPILAKKTARYVCCHCKYEISDDQRPPMMRSGVWAPAGCGVDKLGRVTGTPRRDDSRWGGQLSSLYSLQLRWGSIAEEFATSMVNRDLQMFVNGWLAETWEPHKSKNTPEDVGERLTVDVERGIIPAWATWLFAAVDVQADHYVYVIVACGPGEREHLVDHGECATLNDVEEMVIKREFEHQDGGDSLCPALTLIDSGYRTKEIYSFCKRFRRSSYIVHPCKGENSDVGGEAFRSSIIGMNLPNGNSERKKKILRLGGVGLELVRVNPFYYEPVLQNQLDNLSPDDEGGLSLHAEAAEDTNLLYQLCNGAEAPNPSKASPNRHLWIKPRESEPNDIRDAKKYARCAMDVAFRPYGWVRAKGRQPAIQRVVAPRPALAESPAPTNGRRREPFRPDFSGRRGR